MPDIDNTFPLFEAILLYRELYKQLVFYVEQSTFWHLASALAHCLVVQTKEREEMQRRKW